MAEAIASIASFCPMYRLVQLILHLEEFLRFRLRDPYQRNPGYLADDPLDILLLDGGPFHLKGVLPALLQFLDLRPKLPYLVANGRRLLVVLRIDQGYLLPVQFLNAFLEDCKLLGPYAGADPLLGTGFVDEVDRLVRKEAVMDVAVGKEGRRLEGVLGIDDVVMLLIALLDPLEDRDRLFRAGFGNEDRLKPALERRILLDVLAVLAQGGGPDALDLSA